MGGTGKATGRPEERSAPKTQVNNVASVRKGELSAEDGAAPKTTAMHMRRKTQSTNDLFKIVLQR